MSIDLFQQKVQPPLLSIQNTSVSLQYPLTNRHYPPPAKSFEMSGTGEQPSNKILLDAKIRMVFEGHSPMESTSPTSSITEDAETPPVERWSRDFRSLIDDRCGVEVFKEYMHEAGLSEMLNFWFACKGLKQPEREEQFDRKRLINAIFKRFIIRSNTIQLSESCRQGLIELYSKSRHQNESQDKGTEEQSVLDENIFDEAAKQVEEQLSGSIYDNFLKSKIFIKYITENSNTNVTQPNKESNSQNDEDVKHEYLNDNDEVITLMPTIEEVNEDSDAVPNDSTDTDQVVKRMTQLSTNTSQNTLGRNNAINANPRGPYRPSQSLNKSLEPSFNPIMMKSYFLSKELDPPPNPYHVRYSTVLMNSKRDSEIQSISSHSTTSDSYSCVSGGSRGDDKFMKKGHHSTHGHHMRPQRAINMNPVLLPNQNFAQRQKSQPTSSLDPSNNSDQFAQLLIEKLNKVRHQQEADLKLHNAIKECDRASPALTSSSQREAGVGQHASNGKNTGQSGGQKSGLGQALKDAWKKLDFSLISESDNGQAILDKHFAQVFSETPNSGTPTASSAANATNQPYPLETSQRFHYPSGDGANTNFSLPPPSPLSPINFSVNSVFPTCTVPVTVKFSNEECPYKLTLTGPHVTLLSFKQQIPSKRGNHQYYFKRKCTEKERREFDSTYVQEKITDDNAILPQCDGKIFAIVELN